MKMKTDYELGEQLLKATLHPDVMAAMTDDLLEGCAEAKKKFHEAVQKAGGFTDEEFKKVLEVARSRGEERKQMNKGLLDAHKSR
jgi:hypothetical protein